MAQLTIRVNGYAYTVGCEDGQEAHLLAMGEQIEHRVAGLKAAGGQSGEARLLLLAALTMADELYDLNVEADELRGSRVVGKPAVDAKPAMDARLSQRLNLLAQRAEEIAASLDRP